MFDTDFDEYKIQIPANVKTRMEIVNGIGIPELIYTTVVGIIFAIIAIIFFKVSNKYMISLGIFGFPTIITFLGVMKDKNNSSISDLIKHMIKFFTNQRFFKYEVKEEK